MGNKKKIQQIILAISIVMLFLPLLAIAQPAFDTSNPLKKAPGEGGLFSTILGCGLTDGVLCILQVALKFLLTMAFVVAMIFMVVGGYRYVTSRGNDDAVEAAKKMITHSIIGVVIIAAAWIILAIILDLVQFGNP